MTINRNDIARALSLGEGKLNEMNIADIKEIMKVYNTNLSLEEVIKIWFAYNK